MKCKQKIVTYDEKQKRLDLRVYKRTKNCNHSIYNWYNKSQFSISIKRYYGVKKLLIEWKYWSDFCLFLIFRHLRFDVKPRIIILTRETACQWPVEWRSRAIKWRYRTCQHINCGLFTDQTADSVTTIKHPGLIESGTLEKGLDGHLFKPSDPKIFSKHESSK